MKVLEYLQFTFFLAGATMSLPKWKWTGDGSFQDKIAGYAKKVDSVAIDAEAKGETALKEQATALKAALDAKDLHKKAVKLAKGIKGNAGRTVGKV